MPDPLAARKKELGRLLTRHRIRVLGCSSRAKLADRPGRLLSLSTIDSLENGRFVIVRGAGAQGLRENTLIQAEQLYGLADDAINDFLSGKADYLRPDSEPALPLADKAAVRRQAAG